MKMMSSTSNTSMSGVTFMFAFGPPLGPTAIPIFDLLYLLPAGGPRGRGQSSGLFLVGQQAKLVHARGTNVIDHLDHRAELCPRIRFDENAFVGPVRQAVS